MTRTMWSQGDGNRDGEQSHIQPLARQNSMYNLTLEEVQNQLGDLGKPVSSMNLDELLKTVWSAEANQTIGMQTDGTTETNHNAIQRQASLAFSSALTKKTVNEVWKDIQRSKTNGPNKSKERQPTLEEMTLEDFLVEAGVVAESSLSKNSCGNSDKGDPDLAQEFHQQSQWIQYTQPPQGMMGMYMPTPQPMQMGTGAVMDISYAENQLALSSSPLMGTLSETQMLGKKRNTPEDILEKTVERRQKRMIKNRESAARSRARKQAYTNELENKVSRLEEENERLRKLKELDKMLPYEALPQPKYQLRRTSSAPY